MTMCKLEHYGNCDPETKDQEYCIFHKPNKSENEAKEFWRKFLERFNPKREKIFIEEIGKEVEGFVFEDVVDCRGFVFPKIPKSIDFSFNCAIFNEGADFSNTVFECDAEFINVIFRGFADFRRTIFKQNAYFIRACFGEIALFYEAEFKGSKNTTTAFVSAKFINEADFEYTEFNNRTLFIGAEFKEIANFRLTNFSGESTDFSEVKFKKVVIFSNTKFKENILFIGTEFRDDAMFVGSKFRGVAIFKDDRRKIYAKFLGKLNFLNTSFENGVNIDLPLECFKLPEAEAEACRVQRIWYEKEGNKDKANEMFVRERRALRRAKVRQAKEQLDESKSIKLKLKAIWNLFKAYASACIEFLLADLTCEYGTNWKKPIVLWIFTVLILFPLLYLVTKSVPNAHDFLSCLYFSIVTATTLGYGDLHPVGVGRVLASAEAIFGTSMWAVFLAVFARKYMR